MIINFIQKQKAKHELLKFYYMCVKKRKYVLYKAWDSNKQYDDIQWLQYAIAYILYKDFNCRDFNVVYDYENHISDKEMENRIHEIVNKYNGIYHYNGKELHKAIPTLQYHTLQVGNIYYNIDDNTMYMWDGKNFKNMC